MTEARENTAPNQAGWELWQAITLGFAGVFGFACMFLYLTPALIRYRPPVYLSYYQTSLLADFISLAGTTLLLAPIVWLIRQGNVAELLDSIGWNQRQNSVVYVGVIGAGALVALAVDLGSRWVRAFSGYVSSTHVLLTFLLYFLSTVLLGPILEEFYFRGILFVSLSKRMGRVWAISLATVLFIIIHFGHQFGVLPIAILLGFVRLKTDSLAACVSSHASYNLVLFCLAIK